MNNILNIWRKEVTDNLRDRKALRQSILVPVLFGVVYAFVFPLLGNLMSSRVEEQGQQSLEVVAIGAENVNDALGAVLESADISLNEYAGTRAELEAEIESAEITLAIIIPADFANAIEGEQPAQIELLTNTEGGSMFNINTSAFRLQSALQGYNQTLITSRLVERGIDPAILQPIDIQQISLTTPEQETAGQNSYLLSILVGLVVAMGGMYVALDVTAGERERGTLEALLLTPASDMEIFTGKLLAVFSITLIPTVATFVAFGLTTNLLPESMSTGAQIPLIVFVGSIIAALPFALAVNVIMMLVAIRMNTFKEAQSAATPVTMGAMFPTIAAGMFPPINPIFFLIPAYGTGAVVGKLAVDGAFPVLPFILSVVGALLVAIIGIVIGMRLFNRERLLYGA